MTVIKAQPSVWANLITLAIEIGASQIGPLHGAVSAYKVLLKKTVRSKVDFICTEAEVQFEQLC